MREDGNLNLEVLTIVLYANFITNVDYKNV